MFVERLLNQGNAPVWEQVARFAQARHRLILDNIANVDTPDYRQKDLSVEKFQSMLRERIEARRSAPPGTVDLRSIRLETEHPERGILFHDGNNRSMEQLQTDLAKNAMLHNLAIEMLRRQFESIEMALRERVT